jgi:ABC-type polar amino acid transport system ATPase subunit
MTGASLLLGDKALPLPASGAFALPLDEQSEDALDQVLAQLRQQAQEVAWLPAEGGLVSNLSLLENCLLPLQWHLHLPAAEVEKRCAQGLQCMGMSLEEAGWLRQRPAQASRLDRQRALCLRVLLLQPALVLIGPGALRGRMGGESMETLWPRWLSASLLLYAGSDSGWPPLATPSGA